MIPPSITQAQLRCSQPLLVPFGKVRVSVSRVEAAGPQQRAWAPAAVGASSLRQDSLCWGRTVSVCVCVCRGTHVLSTHCLC
jgi:hypothetical protein